MARGLSQVLDLVLLWILISFIDLLINIELGINISTVDLP